MMSARVVSVACLFFGSLLVWFVQSRLVDTDRSLPSNLREEGVDRFVSEIKARMVFVEGGSFLMGDYGISHGEEGVQLDFASDSKPLHKVALSSYYIDKYKVTDEGFDLYLKYRGYVRRTDTSLRMYSLFRSHPRLPANLDWFEAENYCAWLAEITSLPFSLATEAQWEYAARSRGQFFMVATDDGTYRFRISEDGEREGENISTSSDRRKFAKALGWDASGVALLPVDRYPPNALGVYSMTDNGLEWVKDWYDADYYKYSPEKDPQGPDQPAHQDFLGRHTKVMRGQSRADEYWPVGVVVHRAPVDARSYSLDNEFASLLSRTARCVINSRGL